MAMLPPREAAYTDHVERPTGPTHTRSDTYQHLQQLMESSYTTTNLAPGIDPDHFRNYITGLNGIEDPYIENYDNSLAQRDQSVKFTWGHNHEFGTFYQPGLMRDRHIQIIADFIDPDNFETLSLPLSLAGKKVLDIGCWTGGMSLLMAAMGAKVTAVEEVVKYARAAQYLARSFGLGDNLTVLPMSLYDCEDLATDYDIVVISGVLYHVTDIVLALRITFNRLREGGKCYIETAAATGNDMVAKYGGPTKATIGGTARDRNRQGWNWHVPTVPTLRQMVLDVGYEVFMSKWLRHRLYAVAVKDRHVDMLRAGLSRRVR